MSKIIPDKIAILLIKLFKTNLNMSEDFLKNPLVIDNYKVNFGHDTDFDFESKTIRIRLEIMLDGLNDKEEMIGIHAEYGIEFHFYVDNLDEFVQDNEGKKVVDSILGTTLLSIAFSTSRGIILERTQGTYFEGVILPVIDPRELLVNSKK
jgi:hypothetical protein